jgi:uncharacterized membrane protein
MQLLADSPFRFDPLPLLLPAAAVVMAVALAADGLIWLGLGAKRRQRGLLLWGAISLAAAGGAAAGGLLVGPWVGLPLLCLSAVWMGIRAYWRTTTPVRGAIRAALLALRIVAILLLLAFLARPILQYSRTIHERAAVLVLVDSSRSMGIKDAAGGAPGEPLTRAQAVQETIRNAAARYEALKGRYDVHAYRFARAAETHKAELLWPLQEFSPIAEGNHTAIGDAMKTAFNRHSTGTVAGVFVLTDGANNLSRSDSPGQAARTLGARGVRTYLVPFGSPEPLAGLRDIVLRNLEVKPKIAAFSTTPVKVRMDLIGLQDQDVAVELQMDDEPTPHKRRTIAAGAAQETRTVELDVTAGEPGFHKLTVVARAPSGVKLASENNRLSAYIQVVDEGVRVLYVGGRFRWETKFLSKSLATYSDIRFERRIFFRPPGVQADVPLPGTPEQWARYHVVLFGDVPKGELTDRQLDDLHDAVDRLGTGFLMTGGYRSFGAGGYGGTRIADLLPVEIRNTHGQIDKPMKIRPTAEGLRGRIVTLVAPEGLSAEQVARRSAAAWAELPTLQGASQIGAPKVAATVHAVADDGSPVLITAPYGKGRTAALTVDTTWLWYFNPAEQDTRERHKRFWRQLVLWLANRKPAVWINADRSRYQLPLIHAGQEKVRLTAGVTDADGRPMPNAVLDVRVGLTGGAPRRIQIGFNRRTGLFDGEMLPEADGDYEVTLTARDGAKVLGSSTTRFTVYSPDVELQNALADMQTLEQMAREGGESARIVPPGKLGEAFEQLREQNVTRSRVHTEIVDLPDRFRWWLFAAVLGLTAVEWALRKRRGLV